MNAFFRSARGLAAAMLVLSGLLACASHERASLVQVRNGEGDRIVILSRAVPAALSGDDGRSLPENSRWRRIGAVPQGDVYRRLDDRFVVRAQGREREAYLVESNGKLMGFYLPGESWFVPLSTPVRMPSWQR
ncbi:hypothetical protein [Bordetella genomosp. 12]|uniref:Lipoprotein n=1 Tax=Bordetella genomosp. 12 TaxID=463035 RepID=A0A261VN78_9BORD|nr:hypothetical protein [Bordetella genomosp. 12]OZI75211.1 hypothetical protein CAL22_09765 [Bordetella genomosp. 12]